MTLLEFAKKTSPTPLTAWQREFLTMYERAVKDDVQLICIPSRFKGRDMVVRIINEYYQEPLDCCEPLEPYYIQTKPIEVYCQGTKKIGIPCRRYLGKVEGKAELLCPICKTVNVVEGGKVTVKERGR